MIYLLHARAPLGGKGRASAVHYLGYCNEGNLWKRMRQHSTGTSKVPIIEAFKSAGIPLYLVRVWPESGRALERHLKNVGHHKQSCPVCNGILPLERAVSIDDASQLTLTFDEPPSPRPTREALIAGLSGTHEYKGGLLTQLVIQVPAMWSGSHAGVILASPGGPGSRAVVLTSGLVARSVGTKRRSSDSGKTEASDSTPASQRKLPTVGAGPTPHDMQLELGLTDEEGYQV
jgi:hypothetical protein